MYVIIKKTSSCFGRKEVPDQYITDTNIISCGEFHPIMSENIIDAQKFKNKSDAQERIKFIKKEQGFFIGSDYRIISVG